MKLGRAERSKEDPRDFHLKSLVSLKYDAPKFAQDWTAMREYPWLMNNRIGCCTITGIAHLLQNQGTLTKREVAIDDEDIKLAYSDTTGWDPHDPNSDRGGIMVNALNYARQKGIGGYKIGAFARVNLLDYVEVQAAIHWFGGVYIGANLPKRIDDQVATWSIVPESERDWRDKPGSLGGHAFCAFGYDRREITALPWRKPLSATVEWMKLYCDEAWVIISDEWVTGEADAPSNLDIERLRYNLAKIGA